MNTKKIFSLLEEMKKAASFLEGAKPNEKEKTKKKILLLQKKISELLK